MKIKEGFLLKEIAGDHIVVPVGENLVDFSAMIVLNETGVFLWKQLVSDSIKSEEQLVSAVLKEYDTERSIVEKDVAEFIDTLKDKNLIDIG